MGTDPLSGWGLRPVTLADRPVLQPYFQLLHHPLSDYTFSQLFSWSNSLRIVWKQIDRHLCVFANGSGDLTLLMPPIGDGGSDRALADCWELMHDYNTHAGCPEQSRVEYASDELLARFDRGGLEALPMGTDYLYDVQRMIDLAGGDLASKRQLRSRFMRHYDFYAEPFDASKHTAACLALLDEWKQHQDASRAADPSTNALKRAKESIATRTSLLNAVALGYQGLVVYVKEKPEHLDGRPPRWDGFCLRGFTLGERLGSDQASIVIEKTDLNVKGLAQYIFSEFCAREYRDRPLINAGDDWGLESLAWTKQSYRPVKLLQKYVLRRLAVPQALITAPAPAAAPAVMPADGPADGPAHDPAPEFAPVAAEAQADITVRAARPEDVEPAVALEQTCFDTYCLSKRQIQYLRASKTAVFLVAEEAGRIVGQGIALLKHHRHGASGRIYSLAVKPECRGKKIGQKLLAQMIDDLAGRGARRIYLEVERSNQAAVRLYERAGFRNIGVLPDYYGPGRDGMHMMIETSITTRVAA
jgi:ribosomal-protein-alanine acetyltransferase